MKSSCLFFLIYLNFLFVLKGDFGRRVVILINLYVKYFVFIFGFIFRLIGFVILGLYCWGEVELFVLVDVLVGLKG